MNTTPSLKDQEIKQYQSRKQNIMFIHEEKEYTTYIFFFFFKLLKSGSFFVLFLSICVSFQFFFLT